MILAPRTALSPFSARRVDWTAGRKQQSSKEKPMKRSSVVFSVTAMLAVGGCRMMDGNEFAGSTPTAENVALAVPAGTAAQSALTAGDGTKVSALIDQQADSYNLTYAVTPIVNGATGAILILVKTIVSSPPTSVQGDTAVWGPSSEPLEPNSWRL